MGLTLAMTLPVAGAANAPIGTVVDHVLYTDITADIDARPIPTYCITGKTVVAAEDLLDYGFVVIWDGESRVLSISLSTKALTASYTPEANTHPIGAVAGDVLSTDIVTKVTDAWGNTYEIPSWNIQNKTVVDMDDLAAAYAANYQWNQDARKLSLNVNRNAQKVEWTFTEEDDIWLTKTFTSELAVIQYSTAGGLPRGGALTVAWPDGTTREYLSELPSIGMFAMTSHGYTAKAFHAEGAFFTFQCPVYELHGEDPYAADYKLEEKGVGVYQINLNTGLMTLVNMVEEPASTSPSNELVPLSEDEVMNYWWEVVPGGTCHMQDMGLAKAYFASGRDQQGYPPAARALYVIWPDGMGKNYMRDIPNYGMRLMDEFTMANVTLSEDGNSFTFQCPVYDSEKGDELHSEFLGVGTYRIDLVTREMTLESIAPGWDE